MGNTTRAPFGVKEWVNGLGVGRGLKVLRDVIVSHDET